MKPFKLTPSTAHRWVYCGGSVHLSALALPGDDRAAADEGIIAHQVALDMLVGNPISGADDDMLEGAQIFCNSVLSVINDPSLVVIKQTLNAPSIHTDCQGAPDCYYFDKENNSVYIWDYKYGHRFVAEFENWQLISYAAAVIDNNDCSDNVDVYLTIVQPRSFSGPKQARTWHINRLELNSYFDQLHKAAHLAEYLEVPCITGRHCYLCPAAHCCNVLRESAYIVCDIAGGYVAELTDNELGYELQLLTEAEARLKARINGLTDDVSYRIHNGHSIPGFTLQSATARETWTITIPEVLAIGALFGIDLNKPGVLTPAQARKAGVMDSVVANIAERVATAPTVKATGKLLSKIFN